MALQATKSKKVWTIFINVSGDQWTMQPLMQFSPFCNSFCILAPKICLMGQLYHQKFFDFEATAADMKVPHLDGLTCFYSSGEQERIFEATQMQM